MSSRTTTLVSTAITAVPQFRCNGLIHFGNGSPWHGHTVTTRKVFQTALCNSLHGPEQDANSHQLNKKLCANVAMMRIPHQLGQNDLTFDDRRTVCMNHGVRPGATTVKRCAYPVAATLTT